MRNQRGITIVSLVITIVIMFIIASITITNSIGAYKTMAYQTFKSETTWLRKRRKRAENI